MSGLAKAWANTKKKTTCPKERDEASRLAWQIEVRSRNSHQLVFGDESACYLNMRRAYARSPKGQPAYSSEAYRPEGKVNLLACLSLEGVIAPWLVEGGTVNTQVFSYYLEHVLSPHLRAGQILVLDNFPVHKATVVAEQLEKHECRLLFLPTYSPDLNPKSHQQGVSCRYLRAFVTRCYLLLRALFELLFAKLKAQLKTFAAPTSDTLSAAIDQVLKHLDLAEIIGYFRHAGYLVY